VTCLHPTSGQIMVPTYLDSLDEPPRGGVLMMDFVVMVFPDGRIYIILS